MHRLAPLFVLLGMLSGCGISYRTEEGELTTVGTSTPSLSWLTDERQELLADTVVTLAKEHGWAAGCVFRYNADEAIVNEFARPAGTAAYSFVNDTELWPAVVMFVEGSTTASGSYREHVPDAVSFCYIPE